MSNEERLDRAQVALESGDYRAAIIDTKEVLQREPDNVRGRLLLAKASLQIDDFAAAEKELRRAIDLGVEIRAVAIDLGRVLLKLRQFDEVLSDITPDFAESEEELQGIYQLHGEALLGLDRATDARDLFAKILEQDEDNIDAQLGVAASYVAEGNYIQARATVDQILSLSPDQIRPWLMSGDLYYQSRNAQSAEKHFQKALTLAVAQSDRGGEIRALAGLGDAFLVQEKTGSAREIAQRLMELAPDVPAAMLLGARVAVIDREWGQAMQLLQNLLQRMPDYRPAQTLLGAVHMENGNMEQAEMYLSAVVAAEPENRDARNFLAQLRLRQKDSSAARDLLQPLLDSASPGSRALALAAEANIGLGEIEQASEYLERRVLNMPDNAHARLDLATVYILSGRVDDAQVILDSVDPKEDAWSEMRQLMLAVLSSLRAQDIAAATTRAESLVARWPEESSSHALLGAVNLAAGQLTAARSNFAVAIDISPEKLLPRKLLAAAEESAGNYADAWGHYLEIVEADSQDLTSMVALARVAIRLGELEESRRWLERALVVDSRNERVRRTLGQLLLSIGEFEAAGDLARDTLGMAANDAEAHRLLGHSLRNTGDIDGAERAFERAVALEPQTPEHWISLAMVQAESGDREEAMATVARAYEQDPKNIRLGALQASVLASTDRLDAAMDIAEDLVSAHPDSGLPLSLKAELTAQTGDLRLAADLYDETLARDDRPQFAARAYQIRNAAGVRDKRRPLLDHLESNPLNTNIRIFLAQTYHVDGEIENATDEYERVLETVPKNTIALNNLAWLYHESDDPRAEELARQAYEIAPDDGSIADTLGWILVQRGETREGVQLLQVAASLSAENPEIRYHLAAGLAKLGRETDARHVLEQVLKESGDFASRAKAEELLLQL